LDLICDRDLATLERHLCGVLDRAFAPAAGLSGPGISGLRACIRNFVLDGGKRIRPQLCLWTYRVSGGGDPSPGVYDLACAWELFHAFLLAHDDIIDAAETRRGRRSLHRELSLLDHGSGKFGTDLAIVAGDLLFSAALAVVHELDDLPSVAYRDVLKLFSRVASATGFGQAIDIFAGFTPLDDVAEATLLGEYAGKTAAYTFDGPMLSGAIAAGAPAAARDAITAFAVALGQAYQLQNDLLDLAVPAHEGCDLLQGKRTVTLLRARSAMSDSDREHFDARLLALPGGGGAEAVAVAESLRAKVRASGAIEDTRQLIESLLEQASNAGRREAVPATLSAGLSGMLQSLRARYFTVV